MTFHRLRPAAQAALILAGCANPLPPSWRAQDVDTDAGSGPALIVIQSPASAAHAPPLIEGFRVIRLLEPDGRPDPPAWRQALGLQGGDAVVIASDAAGSDVTRQLAREMPEAVRGLIGLGPGAEPVVALGAARGWRTAQAADVRALATVVRAWLVPARGSFRVQP